MRPVQLSEDILPVGAFKTHLAKVLQTLRESDRAVVITQNGKPAAVVLSPKEFDRLMERQRFLEAVREGLADSEAGRLISDRDLTRHLAAEFGTREKK